jgi:arylsulfatase
MKVKLAVTICLALVFIVSAMNCFAQDAKKPNILVIFGDDVGQTNLSAYSFGLMGYRTPNIDRIAKEHDVYRLLC